MIKQKLWALPLTLSALGLSSSAEAKPLPNILHDDFEKTEYVGRWTLPPLGHPRHDLTLQNLYIGGRPNRPTALERLGIDPRDRLFTTTTVLGQNPDGTKKLSLIPDLLYPVKNGVGGKVFGMRLIPVPQRYNDEGEVADPKPSTYYLNPFLSKLFYNDDIALNNQGSANDKSLYVIVPHSDPGDIYFDDFSLMAKTKAEVSTGHASAYAYVGGLGATTRRDFGAGNGLDHSTLNNLYAISVKGVNQEAVNLNLALWSYLYYNNPDTTYGHNYQFAEDYHFDWVVNVNPKEVFAFAKGWLDHEWVRRDLNNKIALKLQDPAVAEAFQRQLQARGEEKPEPFNPNRVSYYELLQTNPALGLYCFEGVTTTNFLGLNVPLTPEAMQVIFGEAQGLKMFRNADYNWQEIQIRSIATARQIPYLEIEDAAQRLAARNEIIASSEILKLTDPRIQNILKKHKALWSFGFSNVNKFTAQNPLFPERDAMGRPVNTDGSLTAVEVATRDQELEEVGTKGMPFKPQTTADILRALIEMYAPFHKVGAVRDTAIILSFVDKIKERTGLLFGDESAEYGFATEATKVLFKHEANLTWARLTSEQGREKVKQAVLAQNPGLAQNPDGLEVVVTQSIRAEYDKYIAGTNAALDKVITVSKNPEGQLTNDEKQAIRDLHYANFSPEEIEHLISEIERFRKERNARLFTRIRELKNATISEILEQVPVQPLRGQDGSIYPIDGVASYALLKAELSPILEKANDLPVKNPDIMTQVLIGEKYVKYNVPPGFVHTLAQGIHETNPRVTYTPVATMINQSLLEPNDDASIDANVFVNWVDQDPHFGTLQKFFQENSQAL